MFGIGIGIGIGLRSKKLATFDADAQAFFNRVTAAGGVLSNTEKTAVNTLVLSLKNANIWTSMKAIYPMVGASAAACAQNLKSSSFTGSFTSGWTFASTGVTPNGTSAYFNTNLAPNLILTQNSTHISFYSRTNISINQVEMGSYAAFPNRLGMQIIFGGNYSGDQYNTTGRVNVSNSDSRGYYIDTRTNSITHKAFKNNSQFGSTDTQIAIGLLSVITNNVYIGCLNNPNSLYSTKECAFSSIGDGLNDTQASNLYTAVQTFNTTLSRQV